MQLHIFMNVINRFQIKEKFVLLILVNFWTFILALNFVRNPSNSIFQFGFGQLTFTGNNPESYFCIFCRFTVNIGIGYISISAEGLNLPWQGLSKPTNSRWALSTTSDSEPEISSPELQILITSYLNNIFNVVIWYWQSFISLG